MKISELRFMKIKLFLETPKYIPILPSIKEASDRFGYSSSTINKIKNSPNYEFYKNYDTTKELRKKIEKEMLDEIDNKL